VVSQVYYADFNGIDRAIGGRMRRSGEGEIGLEESRESGLPTYGSSVRELRCGRRREVLQILPAVVLDEQCHQVDPVHFRAPVLME